MYYQHEPRFIGAYSRDNLPDKTKDGASQPPRDVPGTSPEAPLKILTSGTSKGPSGESQGTNTKIGDLMKKLFFRGNSLCIIHLFLFFTEKKYSKGLNGDVHGTFSIPSCRTSREPNDETFRGRPRDIGYTCSLNSTHKHIKLPLTGYSRLYSEL